MVTFAIPDEIVLVLALLPGYLTVRVGLYAARQVGPGNWSEFEKTAWSLVGSLVIIGGSGLVVPDLLRVQQGEEGIAVSTQLTPQDYALILLAAIALGAVLGRGFVSVYHRAYGLTPMREHPIDYLVRRSRTPIPVRVVTDDQVITGRARYSDAASNLVVISKPRRVVLEDGREHREKVGRFVYVDPDSINHIYFGSTFKPEEGWRTSLARLGERLTPGTASTPENDDESQTDPQPVITVSKAPLTRDDSGVSARGTLRNTTDLHLRFVQVDVLFQDADGVNVGTGFDSFTKCKPGTTWQFEIEFETDDPEAVSSFTVDWHADYY